MQQQEIKKKFDQIMMKEAFVIKLANKLGFKKESVNNYFYSTKRVIPSDKLDFIEKAIDLQLKYDEKIRQIEVVLTEEINNL